MSRIDDVNFARDPRNRERDRVPVLYLDDGTEVELPTTWTVCDVCHGNGKHVNPAIDCNGLSADDFADDPDFADAYMAGAYDVTCNRCGGRTTVRAVDWSRLSPEHRAAYEQQLRAEADDRAAQLAEIRAGA